MDVENAQGAFCHNILQTPLTIDQQEEMIQRTQKVNSAKQCYSKRTPETSHHLRKQVIRMKRKRDRAIEKNIFEKYKKLIPNEEREAQEGKNLQELRDWQETMKKIRENCNTDPDSDSDSGSEFGIMNSEIERETQGDTTVIVQLQITIIDKADFE